MRARKVMIGAVAAGCVFAAGCYIGPPRRRVYYAPAPGPVVVEPAPAPPEAEVAVGAAQPEVIVEAPGPVPYGIVDPYWIAGWWGWEGGRWAWHRGYWTHRPHPGAEWVPHGWVRGPHGGWIHGGGHWR